MSHDRFFLDSIVDHLWVLEGEGVIRDFPGSYTDFRNYQRERDARLAVETKGTARQQPAQSRRPIAERPRKLTFKERKEFEALSTEIDDLTNEKKALEARFNSGETLPDVETMSKRYDEITCLLDEKEMRWLELSELS